MFGHKRNGPIYKMCYANMMVRFKENRMKLNVDTR